MNKRDLPDADYERLLMLRDGLRTFLKWSAAQAKTAGITPSQHQLLLVVRGHQGPTGPTISDVAEHLLLRHNSAVELIDRAEKAGLVVRHGDPDDARRARIALTPLGKDKLRSLSELHVDELSRLEERLNPIWQGLE